ncbi:profilin [Streptomyces sp. NPDC058622]|uniref:profilin n=1 Tax=Streptomyces sp. NPDC058622 TaxID=3346562 RepID=UPI003645F744
MSWQTYVDEELVGTGKVRQGAIIGFDGNAWAASPGYRLLAGEGAAIVRLCQNPAKCFWPGPGRSPGWAAPWR